MNCWSASSDSNEDDERRVTTIARGQKLKKNNVMFSSSQWEEFCSVEVSSSNFWTWTRHRWILLCFGRLPQRRTELWWLRRQEVQCFLLVCRRRCSSYTTHRRWCSPRCSPSHSPDAAESRSWNPPRVLQTGYRTSATSGQTVTADQQILTSCRQTAADVFPLTSLASTDFRSSGFSSFTSRSLNDSLKDE